MNTTRKYPRTLVDAFGPYTSNTLHVKPEPMHKHDRIVLIGSGVAGFVVFILMVVL
jgi:hypothetical protein